MLITSHLVATVLLSSSISLQDGEFFTALASGVALDIDHLFINKKWISDIKKFLRGKGTTKGEISQHSWIQEPLFGLTIGIIIGVLLEYFLGISWWIFPLFQAIHIAMDALMRYEHKPFVPLGKWRYWGFIPSGSKQEFLASSALLIGITAVWYYL